MKYKVMFVWYDEPELETNDLKEAIKFIKQKEEKDYKNYLEYYQWCIDNYDDPTCSEVPSDYYESYYIIVDDEYYDITNIKVLERKLKEGEINEKL